MRLAFILLLVGCVHLGEIAHGPQLSKFQVLVPSARVVGTVVKNGPAGTDFDLRLDDPDLLAAWPYAKGVIHCEVYGYGPYSAEEPGLTPSVGTHLSIAGVLSLDNACHRDDSDGRIVHRGILSACKPKPELHPYYASTLKTDPIPPSMTQLVTVPYWAEVYQDGWAADDLLGLANDAVAGSETTVTLEVGKR